MVRDRITKLELQIPLNREQTSVWCKGLQCVACLGTIFGYASNTNEIAG